MKIQWKATKKDLRAYKDLVDRFAAQRLVRERIAKNVERTGITVSKQRFWVALVGCLLTTQQRSGAGSNVQRFIDSGNGVFFFQNCSKQPDLRTFSEIELTRAGIRRAPSIAKQIESGHNFLSTGGWKEVRPQLLSVFETPTPENERMAVRVLQKQFNGIGPKQSRNLIQWMGLSKHEIPLDSRIMKVLRELCFPAPLSSQALADEDYYSFVLDGLQEVLRKIDVIPCVFDACAFASFEHES